MKTLMTKYILLMLMAFFSATMSFAATATQVNDADDAANTDPTRQRNYPGGRDEEDLKVQETLPVAVPGADRRTVELKVLSSYFKKPVPAGDSHSKSE